MKTKLKCGVGQERDLEAAWDISLMAPLHQKQNASWNMWCLKDFREVCEVSGEGCPIPLCCELPTRLQAAAVWQKGLRNCVGCFSIHRAELQLGHTL